jgi:hypothetical protein
MLLFLKERGNKLGRTGGKGGRNKMVTLTRG